MTALFELRDLSSAGVSVLDCEHKTPAACNDGFPYIAIPDIQDGRVVVETARRISAADLEEWTRRTIPQPGDVIVTRRGRVGDTAPIPAGIRCAMGQNLVLLRSDGRQLVQTFLRWAVRSPQWWSEVDRLMNVGAVFSSLNVRDIAKIRVPVPPLPQQQAIAEVLGALDDKIAKNTKLAAIAKNLAEAHFLDALSGASNEALLGDVLTLEYGRSLPAAKRKPGTVNVYGSGGISGVHNEALCEGPGVVVGRKGTAGAVHWSPRPFFPIDTTFYVAPRAASISQIFSYFLLRTLRLDEMNSDSAVPGLNRNEAHASKIRMPSEDRLNAFTTTATVLFDLATITEGENESLVKTRDALLPQLMSGKLRVKDAEKVLENAGV